MMLSCDDEAVDAPARFRLEPDRRAQTAERRSLRRDLATATAEGSFLLDFQPRLSLRHGRPIGAEALLRWPHRKRGMISPAAFMPIAEETGHVVEIGGWALRHACREAARWSGPLGVSLNVSARQLLEGALPTQVAAALDESGLDPERLELELTEATLIDMDVDTILMLSAIRDLGVGVALDDFGIGLASLAMLKRLPLTAIKLDRSLIRSLPEDAEDAAIARALITVAHALGLIVVAEGVETEDQRAFLSGGGCDEGQGYLFSQPLAAGTMRDLMSVLSAQSDAD